MLSKGSKTFFLVLLFAVFLSLVFTFYDTIIFKEFSIFLDEQDIPSYPDILKSLIFFRS